MTTEGTKFSVGTSVLGCLVDGWEFRRFREVTSRICVTTGVERKALGSIKTDPITLVFEKDLKTAANGQAEIRAAFEAGTELSFSIEDPDKLTTTGSKVTFTAKISEDVSKYASGSDIDFQVKLEITGTPVFTAAA